MELMNNDHTNRKDRAQRQFDGWADGYDRSILQTLLFQPSYRTLLSELWQLSKVCPHKKLHILDVGCGTGQFSRMLLEARLNVQVFGLDYAKSMLDQAQARLSEVGLCDSALFVHADSEHLPFADASFDFLSCANSFHHYPHQDQAVQEFRRVLRPGGRLALIDGFRDSLLGWFIFDVCVNYAEGGVRHLSHSRVREMLAHAGFRLIKQTKRNIWCPTLLTVAEVPE